MTCYDGQHSDEEDRFIDVGLSSQGRVILVVHTQRGPRIRIISARKATRKEIAEYEEGQP